MRGLKGLEPSMGALKGLLMDSCATASTVSSDVIIQGARNIINSGAQVHGDVVFTLAMASDG